jgi:hypothetical protein
MRIATDFLLLPGRLVIDCTAVSFWTQQELLAASSSAWQGPLALKVSFAGFPSATFNVTCFWTSTRWPGWNVRFRLCLFDIS